MKIVFFDGYCGLCNGLVDWLVRVDSKGLLKFASLQGEAAADLISTASGQLFPETVIYLRDGMKFEKSTAVLLILADLGGLWVIVKVFLIVPRFVRDWIYQIVAKNRYRFFKKRNTCRIPSPQEKDRFLS